MARLPRYGLPDVPQHVVQRGNNRTPIFAAPADYVYFGECVATACERYACDIHAYVLMTNHVHLVVTPRTPLGIAKLMQSVGGRYVPYFNAVHGRTGGLWEGRYRATVIETDRYLLECYRYVELNPVRAGMVADPAEYRWSSHGANALGARDRLVSPHRVYRALAAGDAERRAIYRGLCAGPLPDRAIAAIRMATHNAWALGNDRFQHAVGSRAGRRAHPIYRNAMLPAE